MDSLLSLRNLTGMNDLGIESADSPVAHRDSVTVSVASVFKTLFLAWAIYFVLSCVSNRYFHPLSTFPGPFWASVSNFWKLYIVITKESHTRGIKYREKYGPVIRVAPNLFVYNDPELLPVVYHRYADQTDFYSPDILGRVTPQFQTLDRELRVLTQVSIMKAKNPDGSYMTDEEIKVEALVLMVAATDTTAAFVGSFVQNIISHPAVYQRLRAEINTFESEGKLPDGIVSYEQAQVLPYGPRPCLGKNIV